MGYRSDGGSVLGIEFRILGPLEVLKDGTAVQLGTRMQRALLAVLLLRANEVTSTDRLIEDLWPDHAPRHAVSRRRLDLHSWQSCPRFELHPYR